MYYIIMQVKGTGNLFDVQTALDALLSGEFHDGTTAVFGSDASEEDVESQTVARVMIPAASKKASHPTEDVKMK